MSAYLYEYLFSFFWTVDVIGVIKNPVPTLSRFTNKLGHEQAQIKFFITDGRFVLLNHSIVHIFLN